MAQEGTLTKTSISDIAIPDGVREALGRRLNRLSEETNELLQIAAIIGRDFTYDTLTLLGEREEEPLLKMIEEALEARVIEETDQAGRYRFTHAQMQETLLAELSTTRRVRLHGQVGEALEKRYGAHAEERAGRLAMHFSEAATLSPRFGEKAAKYSAIAGHQAIAQSAYPEAARHFRAALSAREGQEMDDEMAELLHSLGKAAIATVQNAEAWRSLRQAFDYYARKGDVEHAAKVAYLVGRTDGLIRPSQTQLIERALTLVEEGSEDYGRLNAALGYSAGMLGDETRSRQALLRAEEVAGRLGLPRLELDVLFFGQMVTGFHLHQEESIAYCDRAIALAQELKDPYIEAPAHFFALIKGWMGDAVSARVHSDACRAISERLRNPAYIAAATCAQSGTALWAGDWARAREALARGLDVAPTDCRHLGASTLMAYHLGDIDAARQFERRLADTAAATPPGPSLEFVWLAVVLAQGTRIAGRAPDSESIQRAARAVLESPVPGTPLFKGSTNLGLSILAYLTHDRGAASELLPSIESLPRFVTDTMAQTDHVRGLLLETLDRVDEAVEAFEQAIEFLGPGYEAVRADVSYDCARIRLVRDAAGDRERARELIDEALATAQTLGMKPLVEKILAIKLKDQGITAEMDIYTSIVAVAESVQQEQPDLTKHAAPDGTVTIMFSDIEDSTVLTERLGDQAWQELLHKHNALIREQLRAHDGYEVKTMGDGFMVAFQSAKKGLECAVAIQKAFAPQPQPRAAVPHDGEILSAVKVRIGLHAGEAIKDGDDFYGKNVIMASRVAGKAVGGEILVSSLLRALVESSVGAGTFGEPREVELKGLVGTHTVFAVEWTV
jgi:class 3 adenylate cyclase